MGRETGCRARFEGRTLDGRAQLESDFVLFRGAGVRVRVPFAEVSTAEAHDGWLRLVWGPETLELELGPQAAVWADRIRSPRTLMDKLGVKAGLRVSVIGLDDPALIEQLAARGAEVTSGRTVRASDLILYRADDVAALERLERLKASLVSDGGIWVVSPKGVRTIRDVDVMAAARAAGLVDVKVARWSDSHTALKLVIPRALR
jgi:Protein of unknown function (DUF3052)